MTIEAPRFNMAVSLFWLVRRKGNPRGAWHIRKLRSQKGNTFCGRRVPLPEKENEKRALQQRGGERLCEWCKRTWESEHDARGLL